MSLTPRARAAVLVVISDNCPPLKKSEIEYYAMLAKTGVHHYSGSASSGGCDRAAPGARAHAAGRRGARRQHRPRYRVRKVLQGQLPQRHGPRYVLAEPSGRRLGSGGVRVAAHATSRAAQVTLISSAPFPARARRSSNQPRSCLYGKINGGIAYPRLSGCSRRRCRVATVMRWVLWFAC